MSDSPKNYGSNGTSSKKLQPDTLTSFAHYDSTKLSAADTNTTSEESTPLLWGVQTKRYVAPHSALSPNLCVLSLMKGLLGLGILGLPKAMLYAGLYEGMILFVLTCALATYTMWQLVYAAQHFGAQMPNGVLDYGNVMRQAAVTSGPIWLKSYGRAVKLTVNSFIIINGFGTCCAYLIYMGETLELIFHQYVALTKAHWICIVMIPLLPMAMTRQLRSLSPITAACNLSYLIAIVIVIQRLLVQHNPNNQVPAFRGVDNLGLFFGTVFFSFELINLVLPIENCATDPVFFRAWNGPLISSCMITMCVYAAVAYYGYLMAGEQAKDSITLNLPTDNWIYSTANALLVFSILGSYVLEFYPGIERIEKWLTRRPFRDQPTRGRIAGYVARFALVMASFVIAETVPQLNLVMSLQGSATGSFLVAIFPPLAYLWTLQAQGRPIPWYTIVLQIFIIFFGIAVCIVGTYMGVVQIVKAE